MTTIPAPDLELSLPARADNVAVVRHVLGGVGDALALSAELLGDVKLAVSEACSNVVVHAYADAVPGLMGFELTRFADHLEIVVRDQGRGMAPRSDSPGLGVGLPLIASLTASLELSAPAEGGTEIRMRFALDPSGPYDEAASAGQDGCA
jgi:serine/threonine-protein kinase RsbW